MGELLAALGTLGGTRVECPTARPSGAPGSSRVQAHVCISIGQSNLVVLRMTPGLPEQTNAALEGDKAQIVFCQAARPVGESELTLRVAVQLNVFGLPVLGKILHAHELGRLPAIAVSCANDDARF